MAKATLFSIADKVATIICVRKFNFKKSLLVNSSCDITWSWHGYVVRTCTIEYDISMVVRMRSDFC